MKRPARRRQRYTVVKPVRFAPEEWERIVTRAEEVNLPPSVFVRQTTLGYRLSRRVEQKAVYHLGRIGNNLNQLARVANTTGEVETSARLEEVIAELLEAIRRLA